MDFDIRKIPIILAIAILFALFSHALVDAIYLDPEYNDYCNESRYLYNNDKNITQEFCEDNGGKWSDYKKTNQNDPKGYCNFNHYCQKEYEKVREQKSFVNFLILSIIGIIAITVGLIVPLNNKINDWIGSGLILGGLINIFIGTVEYYRQMGRFIKPFVLLIELLLVIFLAYKKLGGWVNKKESKKKKQ